MKIIHIKYTCSILLLALFSCNSKEAVPIKINIDQCDFCKMKISDSQFAAEAVTDKGRIYKFDDIRCMISYTNENKLNIFNFYVSSFTKTNTLINTKEAIFLTGDLFSSPMRGNIAAFNSRDDASKFQQETNVAPILWSEILNNFK